MLVLELIQKFLNRKKKKNRIEISPLFTFKKATTDNVMDYNGYITDDGESFHNPNSDTISFWKWQWKMIINEVKKYHGK